jgi:hypothetical protein
MKTLYPYLALACICGALASSTNAEVLLINGIAEEPANSASGMPRPTRGMKMDRVENRFGAPQERLAAIGTPGSVHQPPISRWIYPSYTVYFENDWVITSVVNR